MILWMRGFDLQPWCGGQRVERETARAEERNIVAAEAHKRCGQFGTGLKLKGSLYPDVL